MFNRKDTLQEKTICEKYWAKYKYFVLSKSQKIYSEIREYLKSDTVSIEELKKYIDLAFELDEDRGAFINASEHVWGYFKNKVSEDEKHLFFKNLELYRKEEVDKKVIIDNFNSLLNKYPNEYLKNSFFLEVLD